MYLSRWNNDWWNVNEMAQMYSSWLFLAPVGTRSTFRQFSVAQKSSRTGQSIVALYLCFRCCVLFVLWHDIGYTVINGSVTLHSNDSSIIKLYKPVPQLTLLILQILHSSHPPPSPRSRRKLGRNSHSRPTSLPNGNGGRFRFWKRATFRARWTINNEPKFNIRHFVNNHMDHVFAGLWRSDWTLGGDPCHFDSVPLQLALSHISEVRRQSC